MIAKNFMKYPEALRFQRELFSNGYHNQPRIMRLMQCIFDWTPTAPDWWKEAKGRARDLAKRVKKSINDFFKDMAVKESDQLPLVFEAPPTACERSIKDVHTCTRWNPCLHADDDDQDMMPIGAGRYRNYCRKKYGYQGSAKGVGNHLAYWGGHSQ